MLSSLLGKGNLSDLVILQIFSSILLYDISQFLSSVLAFVAIGLLAVILRII